MRAKPDAQSNPLKKALTAYRALQGDRLDPQAIAVLDRIAQDRDAATAFAKLKVNDRTASNILTACIEGDELARTFGKRIELEREILGGKGKKGRLKMLDKALADLRLFLRTLEKAPADRLSAFIRYDPADLATIRRGLYLIADAIAGRRRIAEETILRVGATRKTYDSGKAAKTAAIGWIAEGVRNNCGRPNTSVAASLTVAPLGCEVTEERLREAARTRKRDWRRR
jgi:hypothetical protein